MFQRNKSEAIELHKSITNSSCSTELKSETTRIQGVLRSFVCTKMAPLCNSRLVISMKQTAETNFPVILVYRKIKLKFSVNIRVFM